MGRSRNRTAGQGRAIAAPVEQHEGDQVLGLGEPEGHAVEHPIECMPAGTGLRAVFDQACAARSLRPAFAVQAAAADAIAELSARGLGVGILSSSLATGHEDRIHALPIRDVAIPALLVILWRPDGSVAARELASRCRTAFHLQTSAA